MSHPLLNELKSVIADGLQSQTLTSCSRWASKRRWMTGDFEGWYGWSKHPWVREMHDSKASINYAMKGAQLGVTEVLINLAFYTLDQRRRDVLYVLPTAKNASDFSKARFNTALLNSAYLKSIFTDTNTIELKQAGTNTLYIRGSRGDSNLKSIPVSVLLLDEIDEMSQRAINLAIERLSGQMEKTIWGISTPTVPNHGIHDLYLDSTQERFTFQCPGCNRWTELVWPECIEIIGESVDDPRCHESFLKCKECGCKLEQDLKPDWLSRSGWHVTNRAADPDIRGFAVSQMYSFTVSPGELVKAYFKGFGDEAANVEFHNSKLGEPFVGDGAKVLQEDIDACIGSHSKDDPRPVNGDEIICMGIDQGKTNFVEVTRYKFDRYSVDLNVAAIGEVLFQTTFYEEDWHVADQLMRDWQIVAAVVDADPQIMEARRFARRFPGYVWLCRYRKGVAQKEIQETDDGDHAPIITVDRSNWLSAALGRFRQPRRILLPRDVTEEYQNHIMAPVRTYVKDPETGNPKATFINTGPDHFAHARTYCEIALPLAASIQTGEDIKRFL